MAKHASSPGICITLSKIPTHQAARALGFVQSESIDGTVRQVVHFVCFGEAVEQENELCVLSCQWTVCIHRARSNGNSVASHVVNDSLVCMAVVSIEVDGGSRRVLFAEPLHKTRALA
jgi:hypothetical protein